MKYANFSKEVLNLLGELGLNKYESRVYFTLVAEGLSSAKNLADITGIPYGKVYEVVNSLADKGFCTVLPTKPMKCKAVSPKTAVLSLKKQTEDKFKKIEARVKRDLEPVFEETRSFDEPKSIFWVLNGRANIVKKVEDLIKNAKSNINIHCSANSLSRLVIHKELLNDANKRGVKINIAGVTGKENHEEIPSLTFCNLKHIPVSPNNFFSFDGKTGLMVEPIPDDDNIMFGRDLGILINGKSFISFLDNFFKTSFKRAKSVDLEKIEK